MASLEELRQERIKKMKTLQEKGIDVYPARTNRTLYIDEFLKDFQKHEEAKDSHWLVGRVMSVRGHGGSAFVDIFDGTEKIQCFLKEDNMDSDAFALFMETIDMGDFIECSGTAFTTKKGQPSLLVEKWNILSKSLRPLPEKWHGLVDEEERFRKRYLDMLTNSEVRGMVYKRSKFWNATRQFLMDKGFLEVETPVLEATAGGADARPFETHHNALDMDVYLRISAGELWQKKLMVAGFPKVFEIGRIFRNEGMSHEHLQDYTQLEFYWAYADYQMGMDLVRDMYSFIAEETIGTQQFSVGDFEIDLSKEWEIFDYRDTIKRFTDVDIDKAEFGELTEKLDELGVSYDKDGFNEVRAIDTLWKYCRKQIAGPGFLVNIPKEVSPLAKTSRDDMRVVEQFQPIIAGSEVGKGYSELNDPIDQDDRFKAQQALRDAGDDEAQMHDHSFVEALEYGMPPTCGFGMSERFFAFLMDKSVRETQLFPLMRPKEE